ncbi:MAG: hypothetical protein HKN41_11825, partial [Ilumatobacter sp.]|nr:hypothetical protein [Ilumatobacter sp.]
AWVWQVVGWGLFTVSAIGFTIAAVRDRGVVEIVASVAFLLACIVFVVPAIANRPRRD